MPSVSLILATADTPYQLIALIRAVKPCPAECIELLLEADAANAADSKISVGDEDIDTDNYGYQLGPGDSRCYDNQRIKVGQFWVMGSADGLHLNVDVTI